MRPEAVRPAVTLSFILVCTAATMLVGIALKAPCSSGDWTDGRQYRRLCYSDIVPLASTEQLAGGRLPFLDACVPVQGQSCDEYPVATMYFMRVASWASGPSFPGFYGMNAALLIACAGATAACLYLMVRGRALYFALAPTLLVYGTMNWDLFAVALSTGALLAYFRRRDGWAGVLLGLAIAAKFYPVLFLVPLLADRLRAREPDRAITLGWVTVGTWAIVNIPFAVGGPSSWFEFFSFNGTRSADFDSLWYVGCTHIDAACRSIRTINLGSAALAGVLALAVWWWKSHRHPMFPRWTLIFPFVVLFLLTNKVYSPQFSLWLLPLFALILPDLRLFIAFSIFDVGVFVTRFSWFGELEGLRSGWETPFEVMVVVRGLILVVCVVVWVLRRPEALPAQEDVDVPPEAEAEAAGRPVSA